MDPFILILLSFQVVPDDQQSLFLCLFKEYYESLAKHLATTHKDLQNRERQNRQTIGVSMTLYSVQRVAPVFMYT